MQGYANSNRLSLKTILFFILVLFVAFLPVSTFLFFLKNDAFNGYFPPKFFMSESIHAGRLPLWNPYINFGIPQYGDMSSGYWSPVTWVIASTVGYNAYTFTLELLFYILLGGIGMYKLTGLWINSRQIRLCLGVVYMCCGYNIAHLQHFNWLSGAAFLPWCFLSYIAMRNLISLRNILKAALCFYLLAASAHPGITIPAFYFFVAIALFHTFMPGQKNPLKARLKNAAGAHILFAISLLLLSAGMLAGYLDILPHFARAEKLPLEDSLGNAATLQSWISVLLPFATVKNDLFYNTDPSMRNSYFSITLLLFFLLACVQKKNALQKFLLATGMFFFLLSLGSIFKVAAYKVIPFIGYVRLNGEFRIFALLCFMLIAAIELNRFMQQKNKFEGRVRWIYYSLEILLIIAIAYGAFKIFTEKDSFIYNRSAISGSPGISAKLKAFIDALSFYDTLWIQGIIQLLFLWGIKYSLKSANWNLLTRLTVTNMIFACLLNIPFTGVGQASVSQVQAVLNKAPKGIPIPPMHSIYENDSLPSAEKDLVGDWSMYNKQLGVTHMVPYPIMLNNMKEYFEKNEWGTALNFLNYPFVFLEKDGINGRINISAYSPDRIVLDVQSTVATELILQQNYYPHWFYQTGTEKNEVSKAGISFMSAPVKAGAGKVGIFFNPFLVKWMMLFSGISLLIVIFLLFKLKATPSSPS